MRKSRQSEKVCMVLFFQHGYRCPRIYIRQTTADQPTLPVGQRAKGRERVDGQAPPRVSHNFLLIPSPGVFSKPPPVEPESPHRVVVFEFMVLLIPTTARTPTAVFVHALLRSWKGAADVLRPSARFP